MTFRDFMQSVLYDPELGYYNTARPKIGPGGDYYTASNVHPAFGAVLAKSLVGLYRDKPTLPLPLTLVEVGAGTGQLAIDVISAMEQQHRDLLEDLSYVIVEFSPAMRRLQHDKLAGLSRFVRWSKLKELCAAPITGIILSNELIDAMPVHRVRWSRDGLEELYVGTNATSEGSGLRLGWGRPSATRLADYIERYGVHLTDGQIIEINLDAIDWLSDAARALERGFLVTIDYGDLAERLYGPDRLAGTLRCFHRHTLTESPLDRIGEQDMTSSVNFTALIGRGAEVGLETVSFERQAAFLIRNGLLETIAAMSASDDISTLKERLAIKNLFVPGGVSDHFRVLVQRKRADC
jgi:SAM-dependent MidA family methyltransferase